MLRLLWTGSARADLRDILDYVSERNPDAAQRLKDTVEHTAQHLPNFPFLYRAGRVPGTREALVHPNYILVYRVGADAIRVLAVLHARQNYP